MATRWSAEEQETLESLLADGLEFDILKQHLPNRSNQAIHRQVNRNNYGINTISGVKRLYDGKRTRNRKKKTEEDVAESTKKIVGESRATNNSSIPTTSESTNKNLSDVIVADSTHNFNNDAFIHLYSDIGKLLNSKQYSLKSISVSLEDTVLTINRGEI